MGLTLVPTPLGNLRDITLRALDVLRDADVIVAEDTRVARRLLSAHGIRAKTLLSYREQNARSVTPAILERARTEAVALVSDAGTPGVSDPGRDLVVAARAAGIAVAVLPGPVAFISAAVLSGFDLTGLRFGGFLPRTRAARTAAFTEALHGGGPTAWYESPYRIRAALTDLAQACATARTFVAREMTKLHEQTLCGTPHEVLAALPEPLRGEIVLVVAPAAERQSREVTQSADTVSDAEIDALLFADMAPPAVAKFLAGRGETRSALYRRVVARNAALQRSGGGSTRREDQRRSRKTK